MSAGLPGASRPMPGTPITRAGTDGGGIDRTFQRNAELDEVPDGLDHRQRTAGEHAVAPTGDAVTHVDLGTAEGVRPAVEAGAGDRVCHEREPPRGDAPEQSHRVGIEMHAVDDHLQHDVRAHECGTDDAGIAVRERAHGIEHVGDGANAPVEGRVRLGRRRVAVAERDRDATRMEEVDEGERSGKLRCEGDEPDLARLEQALEQRSIRIAPARRRMCPEALRRDERPFEMHPEDAGAAYPGGHGAERADGLGLGGRDERRQIGGHAGLEQRVAGALVRGAVGAGENRCRRIR